MASTDVALARIAPGATYGRITWAASGLPVIGARVQVWDSDPGDTDDLMATVYTNSNGDYRARYRGGHWDPAPHWWTIWRPDIYIKVSVFHNGRWITGRSWVRSNHKLRYNLRIDLRLKIPQPKPPRQKAQIVTLHNRTRLIGNVFVNGVLSRFKINPCDGRGFVDVPRRGTTYVEVWGRDGLYNYLLFRRTLTGPGYFTFGRGCR